MQQTGYITVAALISALERLHLDTIVVLSRDQEGNGFAPLGAIEADNVAFEEHANRFDSTIKLRLLTEEDIRAGCTPDDLADIGAPSCVVLWPLY